MRGPAKSTPFARLRSLRLLGVLAVVLLVVVAVALLAPSGSEPAPPIALAPGFVPVVHYGALARDYEFTDGAVLNADWTRGSGSYGIPDNLFTTANVATDSGGVGLSANDRATQGYPYTGGWISTAGHFTLTHGLIDFRARMPAGQGLWGGVWLVNPMGSQPQGEIDVAEVHTGQPHTLAGSLHQWSRGGEVWGESQRTTIGANLSAGYHDYQVVWQPGVITWAIDGVAYAQYTKADARAAGRTWPFDTQAATHLIANLSVTAPGGEGGAPDAETRFPATMQVESVRVWQ